MRNKFVWKALRFNSSLKVSLFFVIQLVVVNEESFKTNNKMLKFKTLFKNEPQ